MLANTYATHLTSIDTEKINVATYTVTNVDADTKTISISEIAAGTTVTGLDNLTVKKHTVTLSSEAQALTGWPSQLDIWIVEDRIIEYGGKQYTLALYGGITPILFPIRTLVTEALADLAVDLDDKAIALAEYKRQAYSLKL